MSAERRARAVRRASAARTNTRNLCLRVVRGWLGVGARYPSALTAWNRARHKHPGDKHPPAGVPVFWGGRPFGHVALSIGGGKVRSTDWPRAGRVGTASIDEITRGWRKPYLGWTSDLNGQDV